MFLVFLLSEMKQPKLITRVSVPVFLETSPKFFLRYWIARGSWRLQWTILKVVMLLIWCSHVLCQKISSGSCLAWRKGDLRADHIALYNYLKLGCSQGGCWSVLPNKLWNKRKWPQVCQWRFRLDTRKNLFTGRVVLYWNRAVEESQSLQIF